MALRSKGACPLSEGTSDGPGNHSGSVLVPVNSKTGDGLTEGMGVAYESVGGLHLRKYKGVGFRLDTNLFEVLRGSLGCLRTVRPET